MNEAELLELLSKMILPDAVERAYRAEQTRLAAAIRTDARTKTTLRTARAIVALNIKQNMVDHYGKARAWLKKAARIHAERGTIPALCVVADALQYVAAIPSTPVRWRASCYIEGLHMFMTWAAEAQKSPFAAERIEAARALGWLMLQTAGDACGLLDANPGDRAMLNRRPFIIPMDGRKKREIRPNIAERIDAIRAQIEFSGAEAMPLGSKARAGEAERV